MQIERRCLAIRLTISFDQAERRSARLIRIKAWRAPPAGECHALIHREPHASVTLGNLYRDNRVLSRPYAGFL
jgi:hypothetical protein